MIKENKGSVSLDRRKEWLPTHVFLLGDFQGQRSLVGYSPWGQKELDTTEKLTHFTHTYMLPTTDLL